jgi:hypothetical protein
MGNSIDTRRIGDLERAARAVDPYPPLSGWLAKVTSASLITGTTARYLYAWTEATFAGTSPYTPSLKTDGISGNAISTSELTNGTYVSYGVTVSNIPTGFSPKAIPVNTYVWVVPFRASDGTEIYLIVNTQAIDGVCP